MDLDVVVIVKIIINTNDINLENTTNVLAFFMYSFNYFCMFLYLGHGPPLISHQQKRTKSLGNSSNSRW